VGEGCAATLISLECRGSAICMIDGRTGAEREKDRRTDAGGDRKSKMIHEERSCRHLLSVDNCKELVQQRLMAEQAIMDGTNVGGKDLRGLSRSRGKKRGHEGGTTRAQQRRVGYDDAR